MTAPPTQTGPTLPSPELLYLLSGDQEDFEAACAEFLAADIAEGLNGLPVQAAIKVATALPFHRAVQVFDEPQLQRRGELVGGMETERAAPLIEALSADQQVELFRELTDQARARLIHLLAAPTRDALNLLLRFQPHTAGGIMTTEFVGVPSTWTADQVKNHIREVAAAKETVYAIYVLDPRDQRLVRVVSLRDIMLAEPHRPVMQVGETRKPVTVKPLTDREEVARLISKYDLLAIPVLDDGGHVLGIVTVDDVIDALVRESTEDVQKFGGMQAIEEPYTQIGIVQMVRKRAGWLAALFVGEMLTSIAMQEFEHEISRAVVLALFIPLIISSGGNSGSQATSLIIRALALQEVRLRDWWRVALRELPAGLALGALLGLIGVVRVVTWQWAGWYDYGTHYLLVALTVGLSLVGVVLFGSLAGSMLPFVLRRLGFDPASASAPFVATLVDVTGLVIYFSVALLLLQGTLL
ncbi:MAG TPA: magnesium transporter [Gemmatimonadales bacterium]|nr:magnesium transporter [Gemmatimonadales bacterium]